MIRNQVPFPSSMRNSFTLTNKKAVRLDIAVTKLVILKPPSATIVFPEFTTLVLANTTPSMTLLIPLLIVFPIASMYAQISDEKYEKSS